MSPVVSNLTISTSVPNAFSRRAISSVCASAMALLRVPMRKRSVTTRAPFSSRVFQDHVGGLLRDHDGRRVGVTRHQVGHHGGIDHAQALEAAHPQALV